METKQLNGYKIEFYSKEPTCHIHGESDCVWWQEDIDKGDGLIGYLDCKKAMEQKLCEYAGLVSDINEELAEKIVDWGEFDKGIKQYFNDKDDCWNCITAKQSFQTLSDLEYCVIILNIE
jgi:hypothetical protein